MSGENIITLENLSKEYSDEVGYRINLLKNISFKVEKGSVTSIIAPTGSGKSSFLKILAGLEEPTSGEIKQGNDVSKILIPSKPSSFPWMNVRENIKFGLDEIDESKVNEIIKFVGLDGYEDHVPHNKSLGFRFRISLAASLIRNPHILILDEPFNEMDAAAKGEIYLLTRSVNEKLNKTIILGTTNITEAIFLSGKVCLMKKSPGEIIDELKVDLCDKRNLELMQTDEFVETRRKIENIFRTHRTQKLFSFSI